MGGVSPLFRVASHYFSEFFNFGLVEYKDVEKLRSTFQSYPKPSDSDLPQAVTLIGQEPSDEEFASVRNSVRFQLFHWAESGIHKQKPIRTGPVPEISDLMMS